MATIDNNNKKAATDSTREELPADIETNTAASNEDAAPQTDNPFKSGAGGEDGEANSRDIKRAMAPLESRTANTDTDEQLNVASTKSSGNENEKSDDGFVDITNDAGEIE